MLNVFLKSCDFQGWSYSEIYNFTISGIPEYTYKCSHTPNFFYEVQLDMMDIIFSEAENWNTHI